MIRALSFLCCLAGIVAVAGCSANHPEGSSPPIFRNESTPTATSRPQENQTLSKPPTGEGGGGGGGGGEVAAVTRERAATGRLGHWGFNSDDLRGEAGQEPIIGSEAVLAESFDGRALDRRGEAGPVLAYRTVEEDGFRNIDLTKGTIRLMYFPAAPGGGGASGQWKRLLEVGQWTADASIGLFAISIDPSGRNLVFQTQDGKGKGETNLQARLDADRIWSELTLVYDSEQCSLTVNKLKRATGKGVKNVPLSRAGGQFTVGSDGRGQFPAAGLIDELETFDYTFGPAQLLQPTPLLHAAVSGSPPAIQLRWRALPSLTVGVERRVEGTEDWTLLVDSHSGWSFTDRSVEVGVAYEYGLFHTWSPGKKYLLSSGVNLPPVEDRGKVMLMVDRTLAGALEKELDELRWDLAGDGWEVIRHDAPRHDDEVWANNVAGIRAIKARIVEEHGEAPGRLKAVYLVGHVSIPYTGYNSEDYHRDHFGAWPADLYYGDVDGIWTDVSDARSMTNWPSAVNVAGDGKFDQNFVPPNAQGIRRMELAVGRVDLSRLHSFAEVEPARRRPARSEIDLMRSYFDKNRRYRHKELTFPDRVVVSSYFKGALDNDVYRNAMANGAAWFGTEPGWLVEGEVFPFHTKYLISALWGFHGGGGWLDYSHGGTRVHVTKHFAWKASEPSLGFVFMKGSYFPDWNLSRGATCDNILRGTLAPPDSGLGAVAIPGDGFWSMERLGMGAMMGDALVSSLNNTNFWPEGGRRTYAWMGDPTLRLQVTAPVTRLRAASEGGSSVGLRWSAPGEGGSSYYVYRSSNGRNGPFQRLNRDPLFETEFVDRLAPAGSKLYVVKAGRRVTTGSGSFTNLSQGVFSEVD